MADLAERWGTGTGTAAQMRSAALTDLREVLGAFARRDPLPQLSLEELEDLVAAMQRAADEEDEAQRH